MSLKSQIKELLEPTKDSDTLEARVLRTCMVPTILKYAKPLKRTIFYIWKHKEHDQRIVMIEPHPSDPDLNKTILYAFASPQDAEKHPDFDSKIMTIAKNTVVYLLFEFGGLKEVDSLFIYPSRNNYKQVIEIKKDSLLEMILQESIKNKHLLSNAKRAFNP